MGGVNRYMSPIKTQYSQTYVDQYVPLPFETMRQAMGTRQKVHDDQRANAEALLLTHVDALEIDKARTDEKYGELKNELDTLVEGAGGDYSKLRGEITKLAGRTKQDLLHGEYADIQQQYNARQAHVKQVMDSKMPESWKNAQLAKDYDAYNQTGGVVNQGHYSGRGPIDYVDMNEKVRLLAADVVEHKIARGSQYYQSEDGLYHVFNKRTDTYDIIDPAVIEAHVKQGLLNDPEASDFIGYRGDLFGYGEGMDRAGYITSAADFYSKNAGQTFGKDDHSIEWDTKIKDNWYLKDKLTGGSKFDPKKGYNFIGSSASSRTVDATELSNLSDEVTASIKDVEGRLAEMGEPKDGESTFTTATREQRTSELNALKYQRTNIKSTLEAMGTKGGFKWEEAYDRFLIEYATQNDSNFTGMYLEGTDEEKKVAREKDLEKIRAGGTSPTFDDFKDAVLEGGYYAQTAAGVDYNDPAFADRNFDENMLDKYVQAFTAASETDAAKEITVENTTVEGGSSTWAAKIEKTMSGAIASGAPELIMAGDGTQFHKGDPRFSSVSWDKPIQVKLVRDLHNGRPAFQVTVKDGNVAGEYMSFIVTPDQGSNTMSDVAEIGKRMYESAGSYSSPQKQDEIYQVGSYMYGSATFPAIQTADLHSKPINKEFRVRLKGQDNVSLIVTPRSAQGIKKYEAYLQKGDIKEPINGKEMLYDNPEAIMGAMGRKLLTPVPAVKEEEE